MYCLAALNDVNGDLSTSQYLKLKGNSSFEKVAFSVGEELYTAPNNTETISCLKSSEVVDGRIQLL